MNRNSSDLDEAKTKVLARRSEMWKRCLTGNALRPGQECIIYNLALAMREVEEREKPEESEARRFENLVRMITNRRDRENDRRDHKLPARAEDHEVRAFYSIFAGIPLPKCGVKAQQFCNAVRKLEGEAGLHAINDLIYPKVSSAADSSFSNADLGLEGPEHVVIGSKQRVAVGS